jgi:hypothetical protein
VYFVSIVMNVRVHQKEGPTQSLLGVPSFFDRLLDLKAG